MAYKLSPETEKKNTTFGDSVGSRQGWDDLAKGILRCGGRKRDQTVCGVSDVAGRVLRDVEAGNF